MNSSNTQTMNSSNTQTMNSSNTQTMNSSNTKTMNSSSRIIKLTTVATVNGRREQHHRSDYRKYLPDPVIRIHLKIEENCHLFLDTFNSVTMNDLTTTLTSRLKMDAKCANQ